MTVPIEVRKSGVYKGNGATVEYPFAFKVFNAQTDIAVSMADSDISDSEISRDTFEVFLNDDQENNPGGYVRFKTAPASGKSFVIVSTVPYLQETRLTNHDRFLPEVLNEEHDKLTILCQQLKEQVERCVIVPITGAMTREELLTQLLETAAKANEYAVLAEKTYNEVLATQKEIEELQPNMEAALLEKTKELASEIQSLAETYLKQIEGSGDWELLKNQISCQEQTTKLEEGVDSGSVFDLPYGMKYLVGHKHVRVSWNGLILTRGDHWEEVGEKETISSQIKINIPLEKGDALGVFIVPLGPGEFSAEIARIAELERQLEELSKNVAYVGV